MVTKAEHRSELWEKVELVETGKMCVAAGASLLHDLKSNNLAYVSEVIFKTKQT